METKEWKVYKWDDYAYWATCWDLERTIDWYRKHITDSFDDEQASYIEEADLDKTYMWILVDEEVAVESAAEIKKVSELKEEPPVGTLCLYDGELCEYVTLREALRRIHKDDLPFIICCSP